MLGLHTSTADYRVARVARKSFLPQHDNDVGRLKNI